jgi:hypothetical protein
MTRGNMRKLLRRIRGTRRMTKRRTMWRMSTREMKRKWK